MHIRKRGGALKFPTPAGILIRFGAQEVTYARLVLFVLMEVQGHVTRINYLYDSREGMPCGLWIINKSYTNRYFPWSLFDIMRV